MLRRNYVKSGVDIRTSTIQKVKFSRVEKCQFRHMNSISFILVCIQGEIYETQTNNVPVDE